MVAGCAESRLSLRMLFHSVTSFGQEDTEENNSTSLTLVTALLLFVLAFINRPVKMRQHVIGRERWEVGLRNDLRSESNLSPHGH